MKTDGLKQAIIRSCTDQDFRKRLLSNPRAALVEEGVETPPEVEIRVYESSENLIRLVLPSPADAQLINAAARPADGPVKDSPPGLTLKWTGRLLSAEGRIDSETAPVLKRELCNARADVDLDLSKTAFLSSAGISALLAGMKTLRESGAHLRLLDAPEPISNVIEIAGFSEIFDMADRDRACADIYGVSGLTDGRGGPFPIAGLGPPCA